MPTKQGLDETASSDLNRHTKARALALGKAIRELREAQDLSRAELLDRFYTELERAHIEYKVKGDWWLNGIENGEKAKQLPREYLDAFIRALNCTKLEAVRLLILADLNTLSTAPDNAYAAGLTYVLTEVFTTALKMLESRIDAATVARLDEDEWMEIGRAVLEMVAADLERQQVRSA